MTATEHGFMAEAPGLTVVTVACLCGLQFVGATSDVARAALRAHIVDQAAGTRVILAHTTDGAGLRGTVVVGPFVTTYEVLKARHDLEQAGAECEVASLLSLAQYQRVSRPAERAEASR